MMILVVLCARCSLVVLGLCVLRMCCVCVSVYSMTGTCRLGSRVLRRADDNELMKYIG